LDALITAECNTDGSANGDTNDATIYATKLIAFVAA
jgi:hypothetical protein